METNLAVAIDQKEDRRNFLGASDCAAVLGMSRWKTPVQIWAEKTGQVEPEDISGKLNVKLGNRLEEVVAELFMEQTGKKVRRVKEPYIHNRFPFLKCHIDRKVEGESAILQCKTASAWKSEEWEDEEIPHEYILQEIHELACTDYDRAYIFCLIGNQRVELRTIERDEAVIEDVVRRESDFWNKFIVPKIMPSSITKDDKATLLKMFPNADTGKVITLPADADMIADSIESMSRDHKALEASIETEKNKLRAMIGDAVAGETLKWEVTNKNQPKKSYVVKESNTRVLRLKKKEN